MRLLKYMLLYEIVDHLLNLLNENILKKSHFLNYG